LSPTSYLYRKRFRPGSSSQERASFANLSSLPTGKFHELIGLSQIAVFDLRLKHGTGLDLTAIECLGARTYIFIQFASSLRGFQDS